MGNPSSDIVSCRWIRVITVALRLRESCASVCRLRAYMSCFWAAGWSEARMKKIQSRLSGSTAGSLLDGV
jgi:hypothetical protein